MSEPGIHHSSVILNLRRLVILRNIAIAGQLATVLVTVFWLKLAVPLAWLIAIIAALGTFNLITWRKLQEQPPHDDEFINHLLVDVIALTLLLLFTGGATNPFAWLLLLPLTIAATVLSRRATWMMAALVVICYCILMVFYRPLPDLGLLHSEGFRLHVIGMWIGFVISAGTVAYFVAGMAETLRARDRSLAAARERELRDDHLVGLGTLAAGAAHELGTPLGTMNILINDMIEEAEAEDDEDELEKLDILSDQLSRCRKALSVIAASAGETDLRARRPMAASDFLRRLMDEWQKTRPNVHVEFSVEGEATAPLIAPDHALTQALVNILQNAADASPDYVAVSGRWDQRHLALEIEDHGPGMKAGIAAAAGRAIVSTKGTGHGLGLYLSRGVINRLGGNMQLQSEEGRGTKVQIRLPLAKLTADDGVHS